MKNILSLLGFGNTETVKVLTAEERLELIYNKANAVYSFGPEQHEAKFVTGTDGIDVEEISEEELGVILEANRKNTLIDRLIENPELKAESEKMDVPQLVCSSWGHINPKGRRDGGG